MRVEAIIQSTGYHDMLDITLPINKKHFENVIVYTKYGDELTKEVCRKNSVICIETNNFTKNNSRFNRGAVYNEAFGSIIQTYLKNNFNPDWVCIIDSDIILPNYFRQKIELECCDKEYFYGARRYNIENQEQWELVRRDENYLKNIVLYRGYGYGYLQIFNLSSKTFLNLWKQTGGNPYLEWNDNSTADWVFRNKWGEYKWNPILPDNSIDHSILENCDHPSGLLKQLSFNVIHLGITGTNSDGRYTPLWKKKIKIAYFDLGYSKEQYGIETTKYGGGSTPARFLKEDNDIEFHIFAPQAAFDNIGNDENKANCHILPDQVCSAIKRGVPIDTIINNLNYFDILMHPHTCETIYKKDLKIPLVHFCGFGGDAGHPNNEYILLYDTSFKPQFGEKAKYVTIGKPCPKEYVPCVREPYIFQCTRHDDHMNSIELAKQAISAGIKCIFAGPIHNNYKLLDYIDNKNTFYLGEITESEKLEHCRKATIFAVLYNWEPPFSLSIIEAQSQGCPIYVNNRGVFLNKYLIHDVNGFDSSKISLKDAFDKARNFDMSKQCWESAKQYDSSAMVESFKKAFREIVDETNK